MDKPDAYHGNNKMQRIDAADVLEKFSEKLQNPPVANVLDVGCGDGDVLLEILVPRLPKNSGQILGIDISENMIDFAKKRARSLKDTKVDFCRMDIAADCVPEKFLRIFDHVFSFYTIHWIMNQRGAFRNIYEMMKPGGVMILAFLASNPIFDIYEKMSKSVKWAPFMRDVKNFVSPYHHSRDPIKDLATLLKDLGFKDCSISIDTKKFTFPNFQSLSKAVEAVNPFFYRIPDNLKEDYINDYIQEVRNLKNVQIETINNNANEEKVHMNYKLFSVYARKDHRI